MKKQIIISIGLIALFFLIYIGNEYRKYRRQSKASTKIQELYRHTISGAVMDPTNALTNYFDFQGKVLEYFWELFPDNQADNFKKMKESSEYYSIAFKDPWGRHNQLMRIVPVYDKQTKFAVANLILSAGIDGKMDYHSSDTLFTDDLRENPAFYNSSDYYKKTNIVTTVPTVFSYSFVDFLKGGKDFIYAYIDFRELLKQNNHFNPENCCKHFFLNMDNDKRNASLSFSKLIYIVRNKSCSSKDFIVGNSVCDTAWKYKISANKHFPDRFNEASDTLLIKGNIIQIDTSNKTILVKNGILLN